MVIKKADELHNLVRDVLLAAGASEPNANDVAEHLVSANLSGVDTHGVWHLPGYVATMKAGEIAAAASPEVVRETNNSALVTGNWTFGHVAAKAAMEVAIEKAEEHNMAVVGLVQSHHIGRLGMYAEMAAAKQMISMIWAGGFSEDDPAAVPYGGRKAVLHTNPIALGFPACEEPPMIVDYATTTASGSKVFQAIERNEAIPPNWIVDKDGNPTTDPNDLVNGGAHLPFGGHKGYGVMLAAEFLGGILLGPDAFFKADTGSLAFRHQGVTMIALRADLFQPFADYADSIDQMKRRIRAVPPASGFTEVLVPGDLEARTRADRLRDGIPISDGIWQSLAELAGSLGVAGMSDPST